MKYKLDNEEKEILNDYENDEYIVQNIGGNYDSINVEKSTNLNYFQYFYHIEVVNH